MLLSPSGLLTVLLLLFNCLFGCLVVLLFGTWLVVDESTKEEENRTEARFLWKEELVSHSFVTFLIFVAIEFSCQHVMKIYKEYAFVLTWALVEESQHSSPLGPF